jgi:hypothetical protein
LGSNALLFDGGGKDSFSMSAEVRYADPTVADLPAQGHYFPQPTASTYGQAAMDLAGVALLLEGDGDTTYSMDASSSGWRASRDITGQVVARSFTPAPAIAAIDDPSGDDVYEIHTTNSSRPAVTVDQSCRCSAAEAILNGIGSLPMYNPSINAQVVSGFSSLAMLWDGSGDDHYLIDNTMDWRSSLISRLPKASLPPIFRVFGVSYPALVTQGFGMLPSPFFTSALVAGGGFLVDEAGTDTYRTSSEFDLSAKVVGAGSDKADVRALYGWGATGPKDPYFGRNLEAISSQGTGPGGRLIDMGGSGDVFEASNQVDISTVPAGGDYYQSGFWPTFQGSSIGGQLIALGDDPYIHSNPSMPVQAESPGVHGFGIWLGCCSDGTDADHQKVDGGSGYGSASGAVGVPPSIEMLPVTPAEAIADPRGYDRMPVGARLLDGDGKPLAHRWVHFDLQSAQLIASGTHTAWQNIYQKNAITDGDGIAQAALPLWISFQEGDDLIPDGNLFFRVLATFDGEKGVYPVHVDKLLRLQRPGETARRVDWLTQAKLP